MYNVMSHTWLIITVCWCMASKWQPSQIHQIHLYTTFGGDASIWTCYASPCRSIVQYHANLRYWDYFQNIMDKYALQLFCASKRRRFCKTIDSKAKSPSYNWHLWHLIHFHHMERYFPCMSSFSSGGFYVSGSSENLVELSNYECII